MKVINFVLINTLIHQGVLLHKDMASENQYNNLLGELLVLFDEALFRYFTDREIDADKFFGNFGRMVKRMISIEQKYQFVDKQRLSPKMRKIPELMKTSPNLNSRNPSPSNKIVNTHSNIPNYLSLSPKNFHSLHLQKNPRPQTSVHAKDNFQQSNSQNPDKFIIDFENGRPKTSFARSHPAEQQETFKSFRRSPNLSFYEKRNNSNPSRNPAIQSQTKSKNQIVLSKKPVIKIQHFQGQLSNDRKPLYDELQKSVKPFDFNEVRIKLPSKKKLNSQRWSYKVNKLF